MDDDFKRVASDGVPGTVEDLPRSRVSRARAKSNFNTSIDFKHLGSHDGTHVEAVVSISQSKVRHNDIAAGRCSLNNAHKIGLK